MRTETGLAPPNGPEKTLLARCLGGLRRVLRRLRIGPVGSGRGSTRLPGAAEQATLVDLLKRLPYERHPDRLLAVGLASAILDSLRRDHGRRSARRGADPARTPVEVLRALIRQSEGPPASSALGSTSASVGVEADDFPHQLFRRCLLHCSEARSSGLSQDSLQATLRWIRRLLETDSVRDLKSTAGRK